MEIDEIIRELDELSYHAAQIRWDWREHEQTVLLWVPGIQDVSNRYALDIQVHLRYIREGLDELREHLASMASHHEPEG